MVIVNENSDEIVSPDFPSHNWVETAFGRKDFDGTEDEDKAKRVYRDNGSAKAMGVDSKAVRAWAKEQGLITASKGKMNKSIIALFKKNQGN